MLFQKYQGRGSLGHSQLPAREESYFLGEDCPPDSDSERESLDLGVGDGKILIDVCKRLYHRIVHITSKEVF